MAENQIDSVDINWGSTHLRPNPLIAMFGILGAFECSHWLIQGEDLKDDDNHKWSRTCSGRWWKKIQVHCNWYSRHRHMDLHESGSNQTRSATATASDEMIGMPEEPSRGWFIHSNTVCISSSWRAHLHSCLQLSYVDFIEDCFDGFPMAPLVVVDSLWSGAMLHRSKHAATTTVLKRPSHHWQWLRFRCFWITRSIVTRYDNRGDPRWSVKSGAEDGFREDDLITVVCFVCRWCRRQESSLWFFWWKDSSLMNSIQTPWTSLVREAQERRVLRILRKQWVCKIWRESVWFQWWGQKFNKFQRSNRAHCN